MILATMRSAFIAPCWLVLLATAVNAPVGVAQDFDSAQTKTDARRVGSERNGFSFVLPKGWKQVTFSRTAFLEFVGPVDQKAPNVNVRVVPYYGADVRAVCEAVKAAALAGGDDEWTHVSECFLEIDGHRAFFLTFTQVNRVRGIRFKAKMLQCFIANKPSGYIMTFSCLDDLFDQLRPSFEKSAKSVRLGTL